MKNILIGLVILLSSTSITFSQNVVIVVVDGARYTETFGATDTYIPNIWGKLREKGTIYTNIFNTGLTKTISGHSSIITGKWQNLANDGSEHPKDPTIFEYFREQKKIEEEKQFVVAGANKLSAVSFSIDTLFGQNYKAAVVTNDYTGDLLTYQNLMNVLNTKKPQLLLVNFKEVDISGHSGNWDDYLNSLRRVDSLIYSLWNWIETNEFYANKTTMIVTNDHGRHDDDHGGFTKHGCTCEGCQHLMLLAIGNNIPQNLIIDERRSQIDIAPTVAELLSFDFPSGDAYNLLNDFGGLILGNEENLSTTLNKFRLFQNYPNPFNPSTKIRFELSERSNVSLIIYNLLGEKKYEMVKHNINAGFHEIEFNPSIQGQNYSSGIYIYKLIAGDFVDTKKMIIMK